MADNTEKMAEPEKPETSEEIAETKEPEEREAPGDRDPSTTVLYRCARNIGRTARVLRNGSRWLLSKGSESIASAAGTTGKGLKSKRKRISRLEGQEEDQAQAIDTEASGAAKEKTEESKKKTRASQKKKESMEAEAQDSNNADADAVAAAVTQAQEEVIAEDDAKE